MMIFDSRRDRTFQICICVYLITYACVFISYISVVNLVCFDVESDVWNNPFREREMLDLRTNPCDEEGDDISMRGSEFYDICSTQPTRYRPNHHAMEETNSSYTTWRSSWRLIQIAWIRNGSSIAVLGMDSKCVCTINMLQTDVADQKIKRNQFV